VALIENVPTGAAPSSTFNHERPQQWFHVLGYSAFDTDRLSARDTPLEWSSFVLSSGGLFAGNGQVSTHLWSFLSLQLLHTTAAGECFLPGVKASSLVCMAMGDLHTAHGLRIPSFLGLPQTMLHPS
jgi:hypothetical protein